MLCHIVKGERPGAVLVFMTGWDDINSLKNQLEAHPLLGDPNKVLLLACHGSMASAEQVVLVSIVCLSMHTRYNTCYNVKIYLIPLLLSFL